MTTTLKDWKDPARTIRKALPYQFDILPNGKMKISTTLAQGHTLIVSRGDVDHILLRDDLDAHRRRMYEAAIEEWKKHEAQQ